MTTIRVNQWRIKHNAALKAAFFSRDELDKTIAESPKPPILIEYNDGEMIHATTVHIYGPSNVIYRPDDPLPCGASCWMETDSAVIPTGSWETATPEQLRGEDC